MRIEINAGGLGGAMSINTYQKNIKGFAADIGDVIDSFKTVKSRTYDLNGGVGSLRDAVDSIENRIRKEEEKKRHLESVQKKSNNFIDLAIRVDQQVAQLVDRNKDEFYKANPWARPSASIDEIKWYERVWQWLCDGGSSIAEGVNIAVNRIGDTAKKLWDSIADFYKETVQPNFSVFTDVLEDISGALSFIAGYSESEGLSMVKSSVLLMKSIIKGGNEEFVLDPLGSLRSVLDVFSSGLGILKSGFKLKGWKEDAAALGIITASLGIFKELTKASERNVSDQLKNSSGIINKGGVLTKAIWKFTESGKQQISSITAKTELGKKLQIKEIEKTNANNIAAITSLFSMGTRAVGEVIEKSSDGEFDINDYGDTLLSTGITGASSLLSSFTFGGVKIDVDRSKGIFDKDIRIAQDVINGTGAPVPVKVLMSIPGTVIVAGAGAVETVYDFGYQLGDDLSRMIWGDK